MFWRKKGQGLTTVGWWASRGETLTVRQMCSKGASWRRWAIRHMGPMMRMQGRYETSLLLLLLLSPIFVRRLYSVGVLKAQVNFWLKIGSLESLNVHL